jgi:hypothetical protein
MNFCFYRSPLKWGKYGPVLLNLDVSHIFYILDCLIRKFILIKLIFIGHDTVISSNMVYGMEGKVSFNSE